MINLTFPDSSVRAFEPGITGAEIAAGISKVTGQEGGGDDGR